MLIDIALAAILLEHRPYKGLLQDILSSHTTGNKFHIDTMWDKQHAVDTAPKFFNHSTMRLSPLQSVNRTIYQNVRDNKYLKKIFDHFHFHCIFDHLSHEQSEP